MNTFDLSQPAMSPGLQATIDSGLALLEEAKKIDAAIASLEGDIANAESEAASAERAYEDAESFCGICGEPELALATRRASELFAAAEQAQLRLKRMRLRGPALEKRGAELDSSIAVARQLLTSESDAVARQFIEVLSRHVERHAQPIIAAVKLAYEVARVTGSGSLYAALRGISVSNPKDSFTPFIDGTTGFAVIDGNRVRIDMATFDDAAAFASPIAPIRAANQQLSTYRRFAERHRKKHPLAGGYTTEGVTRSLAAQRAVDEAKTAAASADSSAAEQ